LDGEHPEGGIIMKSLQGLYDEVKGDDALKRSFVEAMRAGIAEDFIRGCGCEVTTEELREFLEGRTRQSDPIGLSADELADVAGGMSYYCGEPCSNTNDCSDTCISDCC
jgi:hypothetical protein